jgi:hypothetical protein
LRYLRTVFPVFMGLVAGMPLVHAQSISAYYSVGTATDSSSNTQIDTFGTGIPFTTPKLAGLTSDIGGLFMFSKHLGASADLSWRDSSAAYAGLNYRPFFYNFDAVYEPIKTKRVVPELRAGLGGVNLSYTYSSTACDPLVGCSSSTQPVESSHHFQVDMQAAARVYFTNHLFLRPAVEAHYVNNFFQFGSNWVPSASIGIGYTFGSVE